MPSNCAQTFHVHSAGEPPLLQPPVRYLRETSTPPPFFSQDTWRVSQKLPLVGLAVFLPRCFLYLTYVTQRTLRPGWQMDRPLVFPGAGLAPKK